MAVAKSYIELPIVEEPYELNGRMYCKVRKKNGNIQQVRWYTDAEFRKMYPEEVKNTRLRTEKEVFGFEKGYITLVKTEEIEWLEWSNARFATFFGWYIVSTEEIPEERPDDLKCVRLPWDMVGNAEGYFNDKQKIAEVVESILNPQNTISQWVGSIGERMELDLEVIAARSFDSAYGLTTTHTFVDSSENIYVWTTAAKNWSVGTVKRVRATIKEYKTNKGCKQTILTRCMEVK